VTSPEAITLNRLESRNQREMLTAAARGSATIKINNIAAHGILIVIFTAIMAACANDAGTMKPNQTVVCRTMMHSLLREARMPSKQPDGVVTTRDLGLQKEPMDPWGNPIVFQNHSGVLEAFSAGQDRVWGTVDDIRLKAE
jgi:hypothetical protein